MRVMASGVKGFELFLVFVFLACHAKTQRPLAETPNYEGRITGFSFETGAGTPGELVRFTMKSPPDKVMPPEAYIRVDSITQFKVGPAAAVDWTTQGLPDLRSAYVRIWFHADRHISVTKNEVFGTARIVAVDSTPLAKRVR